MLLLLGSMLGAQTCFYDLVAVGTSKQVLAAIMEGASANQDDRLGVTPLMAAAFTANPRVLGLLLNAGAAADTKNRGGKTALDLASRNENVKDFKCVSGLAAGH